MKRARNGIVVANAKHLQSRIAQTIIDKVTRDKEYAMFMRMVTMVLSLGPTNSIAETRRFKYLESL